MSLGEYFFVILHQFNQFVWMFQVKNVPLHSAYINNVLLPQINIISNPNYGNNENSLLCQHYLLIIFMW